ncbi:MAG: hypothetical protein JXB17_13350 [Bacteroidales bacterium]|nr:hypothetical protein [Bacteroidales bacterium]
MNIILYPFDIELNNKDSFAFTINLANRIKAPIILFTNINPNTYYYHAEKNTIKTLNKEKEKIHHHILELKGFYLSFYQNWKAKLDIEFKLVIGKGNIKQILEKNIIDENANILIIDPEYAKKCSLNSIYLNNLAKNLKITYAISKLTKNEKFDANNLVIKN